MNQSESSIHVFNPWYECQSNIKIRFFNYSWNVRPSVSLSVQPIKAELFDFRTWFFFKLTYPQLEVNPYMKVTSFPAFLSCADPRLSGETASEALAKCDSPCYLQSLLWSTRFSNGTNSPGCTLLYRQNFGRVWIKDSSQPCSVLDLRYFTILFACSSGLNRQTHTNRWNFNTYFLPSKSFPRQNLHWHWKREMRFQDL